MPKHLVSQQLKYNNFFIKNSTILLWLQEYILELIYWQHARTQTKHRITKCVEKNNNEFIQNIQLKDKNKILINPWIVCSIDHPYFFFKIMKIRKYPCNICASSTLWGGGISTNCLARRESIYGKLSRSCLLKHAVAQKW